MSKKHYDMEFKKKAIAYLNRLNDKGHVIVRENKKETRIENVRALCEKLCISSYSLYKWNRDLKNIKNSLTPEELNLASDFFDTNIIEEEIKIVPKKTKKDTKKEELLHDIDQLEKEYGIKKEESDIFGIRFYSWLAKSLGVKNYSRMNLKQLQCALGLALIKESGIVDTKKHFDNLRVIK